MAFRVERVTALTVRCRTWIAEIRRRITILKKCRAGARNGMILNGEMSEWLKEHALESVSLSVPIVPATGQNPRLTTNTSQFARSEVFEPAGLL